MPTGNVKVSVDVTNTGKRAGEEVVQLYIHDVAASVTRPVKELKGFQRVSLKAGEKRTIEFTLTPEELSFYDRDLKPTVETGEIQVFVGTSSDSGLQSSFEIVNRISAKPVAQKIENEAVDPAPTAPVPTAQISKEDDIFLDDLQKKTFQFFWENSNPKNGLTLDRTGADGTRHPATHPSHNIASSAATGFALSVIAPPPKEVGLPKNKPKSARKKLSIFLLIVRSIKTAGFIIGWIMKPANGVGRARFPRLTPHF